MSLIGRIIKDLAPTPENLRNSEGAFIRIADGRIAFVFSRYRDGRHDGDTSDLAVMFSSDEGESWSEPRVMARCDDWGAVNIMSPSLLHLKDGRIAVLYLKLVAGLQVLPFMRTTTDFESFSDELDCTHTPGYFCVANDRMRRLKSGRIIFSGGRSPIGEAELSQGDHENADNIVMSQDATVRFYFSDDEGASFREAKNELRMPHEIFRIQGEKGLNEPGLIELDSGVIYAYCRNASGRQYESYSYDNGETWSTPSPSRFTSPTSPMSTLRLSDGRIVVGYNPEPLYFGKPIRANGMWTGGRTSYVLELTDGNLHRISEPKFMEKDDNSGFGYAAMIETNDDSVLVAYCAGDSTKGDQNMLCRLRIRKIALSELE